MAINEYMLSHKDLVKAVIVHRGIHEGFWCLNINFNIAASHGVESPNPSVALSIMSIGITRSPEANELTVDAAVVNPWVTPAVSGTLADPVAELSAEPARSPRPAAPIVASNTEILASLPSRFGRNIYGNVAVSFRPGSVARPQSGPGTGASGSAADRLASDADPATNSAQIEVGRTHLGAANELGMHDAGTNGIACSNGNEDDTQVAPPITLAPVPPHGTA